MWSTEFKTVVPILRKINLNKQAHSLELQRELV